MTPNFTDRVVGWFSPQAQLARMEARARLGALAEGWDGGSHGRRQLSAFNPSETSPDAAQQSFQMRTLRARARELARNSTIGGGAINTTVTSVVGTGLEFHSRIDAEFLGLDPDAAEEWQNSAERLFRGWAEYEADITGMSTFYGLQALAFRSVLEGGDAFAVLPRVKRPGALFDTRVQLIESELVSNPKGVKDDAKIVAGVEKNPNGFPIAYHFCNQYDGRNIPGVAKEWKRIEAFGAKSGRRNVLHLLHVLRPGQTRGVPFLAPVIEPIKQLKDYAEAEITAAVVSGMFAVFIKTPGGQGFEPLTTNPDGSAKAGERNGDEIRLEPGLVASLGEGEEPVAFNPGRPNTAFDPFVQAILRQIGMRLGIPFEVLIKHFTASYSAARAALLEAWRFFRVQREWLVSSFCQPVFEAWMDEAVAKGLIAAPGYFDDIQVRRAYLGSEWTGDGMGQLNPRDEIEAAKERVALGVSNRAIEASETSGRDWRTIHRQLAIEERERREDGLGPPVVQGGGPQQPGGPTNMDAPDAPDAPDQEDDDEAG